MKSQILSGIKEMSDIKKEMLVKDLTKICEFYYLIQTGNTLDRCPELSATALKYARGLRHYFKALPYATTHHMAMEVLTMVVSMEEEILLEVQKSA